MVMSCANDTDISLTTNFVRSNLLVELKLIQPEISDFASFFHPKYCDAVIEAIRVTSGFSTTDRHFRTPWNATKTVTEVKRAGRILMEECISKPNKELKEQTNDFLQLFRSRTAIRVNRLAKISIITKKGIPMRAYRATMTFNILSASSTPNENKVSMS